MYTCAGLIIYKSNFILLNISYQNEHLECGQNGAATAIPTALLRAGVIPSTSIIKDKLVIICTRIFNDKPVIIITHTDY